MDNSLLDRVIALARADDDIRAVILEGSLAVRTYVDELSDFDINVYSRDFERYLSSDHWMSDIGDVLLYQKEVFHNTFSGGFLLEHSPVYAVLAEV